MAGKCCLPFFLHLTLFYQRVQEVQCLLITCQCITRQRRTHDDAVEDDMKSAMECTFLLISLWCILHFLWFQGITTILCLAWLQNNQKHSSSIQLHHSVGVCSCALYNMLINQSTVVQFNDSPSKRDSIRLLPLAMETSVGHSLCLREEVLI